MSAASSVASSSTPPDKISTPLRGRSFSLRKRVLTGGLLADENSRVKVHVRIRPPQHGMPGEDAPPCLHPDAKNTNAIRLIAPDMEDARDFIYDRVFPSETSQREVFESLRSTYLPVLEGYNSTIMAYGQTGAGKTYSLLELDPDDPSRDGLVPRVVHDIFRRTEADSKHEYLITCSYMQIYNENIHDLLKSNNTYLHVREHPIHGVYVENLSEYVVRCPADALELLAMGRERIVYAETKLNFASSRSHAVFQIVVKRSLKDTNASHHEDRSDRQFSPSKSKNTSSPNFSSGRDQTSSDEDDSGSDLNSRHSLHVSEDDSNLRDEDSEMGGAILVGKLLIVDLAGSERVKKSQSEGARLDEAKYINSSLHHLGVCIQALTEPGRMHVPFRDSKLTRLLQDSLGGNSRTAMLICVAPSESYASETMSSLRFGQRCMSVEIHPERNAEVDFKGLAERLKRQLELRTRELIASERERERLIRRAKEGMELFSQTYKQSYDVIKQSLTEMEVRHSDESVRWQEECRILEEEAYELRTRASVYDTRHHTFVTLISERLRDIIDVNHLLASMESGPSGSLDRKFSLQVNSDIATGGTLLSSAASVECFSTYIIAAVSHFASMRDHISQDIKNFSDLFGNVELLNKMRSMFAVNAVGSLRLISYSLGFSLDEDDDHDSSSSIEPGSTEVDDFQKLRMALVRLKEYLELRILRVLGEYIGADIPNFMQMKNIEVVDDHPVDLVESVVETAIEHPDSPDLTRNTSLMVDTPMSASELRLVQSDVTPPPVPDFLISQYSNSLDEDEMLAADPTSTLHVHIRLEPFGDNLVEKDESHSSTQESDGQDQSSNEFAVNADPTDSILSNQERAATKIQHTFREHRRRSLERSLGLADPKSRELSEVAATRIQRTFRQHRRSSIIRLQIEQESKQEKAASLIQHTYRRHRRDSLLRMHGQEMEGSPVSIESLSEHQNWSPSVSSFHERSGNDSDNSSDSSSGSAPHVVNLKLGFEEAQNDEYDEEDVIIEPSQVTVTLQNPESSRVEEHLEAVSDRLSSSSSSPPLPPLSSSTDIHELNFSADDNAVVEDVPEEFADEENWSSYGDDMFAEADEASNPPEFTLAQLQRLICTFLDQVKPSWFVSDVHPDMPRGEDPLGILEVDDLLSDVDVRCQNLARWARRFGAGEARLLTAVESIRLFSIDKSLVAALMVLDHEDEVHDRFVRAYEELQAHVPPLPASEPVVPTISPPITSSSSVVTPDTNSTHQSSSVTSVTIPRSESLRDSTLSSTKSPDLASKDAEIEALKRELQQERQRANQARSQSKGCCVIQ